MEEKKKDPRYKMGMEFSMALRKYRPHRVYVSKPIYHSMREWLAYRGCFVSADDVMIFRGTFICLDPRMDGYCYYFSVFPFF